MSTPGLLFDEPYYLQINEARWAVFEDMLAAVRQAAPIQTIVDAGCGPGWFSAKLVDAGLMVRGLEGRPELVDVARERAPQANFEVFDFDAIALDQAGDASDAVLAFGLLYHLENPIRTLRLCRSLSRHALFLETMTIPEAGPYGRLVNENPNETQGLRPLALVLTPEAIAASLRDVGFAHVYRYSGVVEHADFADTPERRKRRDIFLATDLFIEHPRLEETPAGRLGRYDYSHTAAPR